MDKINRYITAILFLLLFSSSLLAQNFPGKTWDYYDSPEEAGFSSAKLKEAKALGDEIKTAALTIVQNGKIVYEWGNVETKYMTHSIRKSVLSAMYGNYVRSGVIDLDKTMADFGITDKLGLSEEELKATLRDCIKARSGVYHPALYESAGMKALKPARHTEFAGAHWYYNNWDFNVAGTLFRQITGKDIFEAIEKEIAKPIGMEDYSAKDGWYVDGEESIHVAYPFRITAHDLARFGLLMLNNGNWDGKQVVPADWVEESTRYHSDATLYKSDGYGYMWWVSRDYNKYPHLDNVEVPEGSYSARGSGGHVLLIIPAYDLVIVHRANTDDRSMRIAYSEVGRLINVILQARNK